MAVTVGGRAVICMTPVARRMREVWAAIQVSGTTSSGPAASAVQMESYPRASACCTAARLGAAPVPQGPKFTVVRMVWRPSFTIVDHTD